MLWVLIRITEAIVMSNHNKRFYRGMWKIIPKLSSNTLLIWSTRLPLVPYIACPNSEGSGEIGQMCTVKALARLDRGAQ